MFLAGFGRFLNNEMAQFNETTQQDDLIEHISEEKDEEQQCDLEGDNTSKPYFCTENESIKRNIQMSHIQRTSTDLFLVRLTTIVLCF